MQRKCGKAQYNQRLQGAPVLQAATIKKKSCGYRDWQENFTVS
jgi:hypothetical protein